MTADLVAEDLRILIDNNDLDALGSAIAENHAADIAQWAVTLETDEIVNILKVLPIARRARVFGYFPGQTQMDIAERISRRDLVTLITNMSHDERADLFARLSEDQQNALLPGLAQAEREDIRKLSAYPEDTAGSVMTSDYATLSADLTARAAIEKLRREAPDKETIYESYVVDQQRVLMGVVSLRDLLLARDTARISDIMRRDPIRVLTSDSREDSANKIARYDLLSLPVLTPEGMLVGIITADDAMDVQAEEAARDFHKFGAMEDGTRRGGTGAEHLTAGLKDASLFMLYRMRIYWLVLLVFGNIFSGMGIAHFEDTISAHIALLFFLPLLIASGGNAGAQASTLMVRSLATGDVQMRDWGRMLGKEFLVAGLLGITMALAVSAIGFVRAGPEITLVVCSAMVLIVLAGGLIGMSLPFILSRFKLDPATASAPLITSIADGAGVLIYFGLATWVLGLPG